MPRLGLPARATAAFGLLGLVSIAAARAGDNPFAEGSVDQIAARHRDSFVTSDQKRARIAQLRWAFQFRARHLSSWYGVPKTLTQLSHFDARKTRDALAKTLPWRQATREVARLDRIRADIQTLVDDLTTQHFKMVMQRAHVFTRASSHRTEELTSDAILNLLREGHRVDERGFQAFVNMIVRRSAHQLGERELRQRKEIESAEANRAGDGSAPPTGASDDSARDRTYLWNALQQAFRSLTREEAELVNSIYLSADRRSGQAIADARGISREAVHQRVSTTLGKLRLALPAGISDLVDALADSSYGQHRPCSLNPYAHLIQPGTKAPTFLFASCPTDPFIPVQALLAAAGRGDLVRLIRVGMVHRKDSQLLRQAVSDTFIQMGDAFRRVLNHAARAAQQTDTDFMLSAVRNYDLRGKKLRRANSRTHEQKSLLVAGIGQFADELRVIPQFPAGHGPEAEHQAGYAQIALDLEVAVGQPRGAELAQPLPAHQLEALMRTIAVESPNDMLILRETNGVDGRTRSPLQLAPVIGISSPEINKRRRRAIARMRDLLLATAETAEAL